MLPPFEIRAIRSWKEDRRSRVDATGRTPTAEASAETRELREILVEFDRRLEESATRRQDERDQRARFREEAARLIDSIIAPTLAELGEEITGHGHSWNVESRVDIMGQPAIGCSFSPRAPGGSGRGTSELSFRFQLPDRLTITAASSDAEKLRELPPRSYEMAKVTPTVVREEIVRFLGRALAATG